METLQDFDGQDFNIDVSALATFVITRVSRAEALSYIAAVKATRILAHLTGEDEEEAVKKLNEDATKMAQEIVLTTFRGFAATNS